MNPKIIAEIKIDNCSEFSNIHFVKSVLFFPFYKSCLRAISIEVLEMFCLELFSLNEF